MHIDPLSLGEVVCPDCGCIDIEAKKKLKKAAGVEVECVECGCVYAVIRRDAYIASVK